MFKALRAVDPFVYVFILCASAAALMLSLVPVKLSRVVTPPGAVVQLPPVVVEPSSCLSPKSDFAYANRPFNKKKFGPGSAYKESRNSQGPHAMPEDFATLSPALRLERVKSEFINRHCGGKKFGGDKKLFQVSVVGSDVRNVAIPPGSIMMNPNAAISRQEWSVGLDRYLKTIRWDKSYLVYEKLGKGTWTLAMEPRPGDSPRVKLVKHTQPKSWYLMLAVVQPDGTIVMERRRLECGFQQTYANYKSVPAAFKHMRSH